MTVLAVSASAAPASTAPASTILASAAGTGHGPTLADFGLDP